MVVRSVVLPQIPHFNDPMTRSECYWEISSQHISIQITVRNEIEKCDIHRQITSNKKKSVRDCIMHSPVNCSRGDELVLVAEQNHCHTLLGVLQTQHL